MNTNHAPSHLREEFQEWLGSYQPNRLQEMDIGPVGKLLEALEDCDDVLPADFCDQIDIPKGSSYGDAATEVRNWCSRKHAGKKNGEATKPSFVGCAVLARYDQSGPYSKDNMYFRTAVSEEEAQEGIELHSGADLRNRFLELERHGWVELDHENLASIKD